MEPYVLGVDSGGTKCLIRAVRPDGTFLAEYSGETSRHHGLEEAEVLRSRQVYRALIPMKMQPLLTVFITA